MAPKIGKTPNYIKCHEIAHNWKNNFYGFISIGSVNACLEIYFLSCKYWIPKTSFLSYYIFKFQLFYLVLDQYIFVVLRIPQLVYVYAFSKLVNWNGWAISFIDLPKNKIDSLI